MNVQNRIPLLPATLTAIAAIASYAIAGTSLDFILSPLLFASILVPPLVLRDSLLLTASSIVSVFAIALLIPVFQNAIPAPAWLACVLVIATFIAATTALAGFLVSFRIPAILASAMVTVAIVAWLTCPIWAFPRMDTTAVHRLVAIHPLFAINSTCTNLGIWTEQPLAYQLTTLGQDIPYQLPASIFPCAIAQSITALLLIGFIMITQKRRALLLNDGLKLASPGPNPSGFPR